MTKQHENSVMRQKMMAGKIASATEDEPIAKRTRSNQNVAATEEQPTLPEFNTDHNASKTL